MLHIVEDGQPNDKTRRRELIYDKNARLTLWGALFRFFRAKNTSSATRALPTCTNTNRRMLKLTRDRCHSKVSQQKFQGLLRFGVCSGWAHVVTILTTLQAPLQVGITNAHSTGSDGESKKKQIQSEKQEVACAQYWGINNRKKALWVGKAQEVPRVLVIVVYGQERYLRTGVRSFFSPTPKTIIVDFFSERCGREHSENVMFRDFTTLIFCRKSTHSADNILSEKYQ